MTVFYEWDCELVADGDSDEYDNEDVIDHDHRDTYRDVLDTVEWRRAHPEPGTKSAIALVRDDDKGRSWAYVADGKLPEYFTDGGGANVARVPDRFHAEVAAASKPTGRGGPRPGSGRPRDDGAPAGEGGVLVRASVSMTESQRAKFRALGGSAWFRRMVDEAEVPPDTAR